MVSLWVGHGRARCLLVPGKAYDLSRIYENTTHTGEGRMHKDELIQLHTLLRQMKNYFESSGVDAGARFQEYETFGVAPQHIHKSKMQHKKAVFLLGKELADLVMETEIQGPQGNRVVERFNKLAAKAGGEIIERPPSFGAVTVEI